MLLAERKNNEGDDATYVYVMLTIVRQFPNFMQMAHSGLVQRQVRLRRAHGGADIEVPLRREHAMLDGPMPACQRQQMGGIGHRVTDQLVPP